MLLCSLTHSLSHSVTQALSHSVTLSQSVSHSLTLTLTLSHTLTLTLTHSLSHTLTLTHSLTHSLTLSLSLTHSQSLPLCLQFSSRGPSGNVPGGTLSRPGPPGSAPPPRRVGLPRCAWWGTPRPSWGREWTRRCRWRDRCKSIKSSSRRSELTAY